MKSFKQFLKEHSTLELHNSGAFDGNADGHIHITTYHGGDFGEGSEPVTPSHILFSRKLNQISRPNDRAGLMTPEQPLTSFNSFSTTPNAQDADNYRGFIGKNLYKIGIKVHRDNIKHFDSFSDYNYWHRDLDNDDNFQDFLRNHPQGQLLHNYNSSLQNLKNARQEIDARHLKWQKTIPEIPYPGRNATIEQLESHHEQVENRNNLIHKNLKKEMESPEYQRASEIHSKNYEDLKSTFGDHCDGHCTFSMAIAKLKHEYITDKLGIHVVTMTNGSGMARKSGEIHVLHPSVIHTTEKIRSRSST